MRFERAALLTGDNRLHHKLVLGQDSKLYKAKPKTSTLAGVLKLIFSNAAN